MHVKELEIIHVFITFEGTPGSTNGVGGRGGRPGKDGCDVVYYRFLYTSTWWNPAKIRGKFADDVQSRYIHEWRDHRGVGGYYLEPFAGPFAYAILRSGMGEVPTPSLTEAQFQVLQEKKQREEQVKNTGKVLEGWSMKPRQEARRKNKLNRDVSVQKFIQFLSRTHTSTFVTTEINTFYSRISAACGSHTFSLDANLSNSNSERLHALISKAEDLKQDIADDLLCKEHHFEQCAVHNNHKFWRSLDLHQIEAKDGNTKERHDDKETEESENPRESDGYTATLPFTSYLVDCEKISYDMPSTEAYFLFEKKLIAVLYSMEHLEVETIETMVMMIQDEYSVWGESGYENTQWLSAILLYQDAFLGCLKWMITRHCVSCPQVGIMDGIHPINVHLREIFQQPLLYWFPKLMPSMGLSDLVSTWFTKETFDDTLDVEGDSNKVYGYSYDVKAVYVSKRWLLMQGLPSFVIDRLIADFLIPNGVIRAHTLYPNHSFANQKGMSSEMYELNVGHIAPAFNRLYETINVCDVYRLFGETMSAEQAIATELYTWEDTGVPRNEEDCIEEITEAAFTNQQRRFSLKVETMIGILQDALQSRTSLMQQLKRISSDSFRLLLSYLVQLHRSSLANTRHGEPLSTYWEIFSKLSELVDVTSVVHALIPKSLDQWIPILYMARDREILDACLIEDIASCTSEVGHQRRERLLSKTLLLLDSVESECGYVVSKRLFRCLLRCKPFSVQNLSEIISIMQDVVSRFGYEAFSEHLFQQIENNPIEEWLAIIRPGSESTTVKNAEDLTSIRAIADRSSQELMELLQQDQRNDALSDVPWNKLSKAIEAIRATYESDFSLFATGDEVRQYYERNKEMVKNSLRIVWAEVDSRGDFHNSIALLCLAIRCSNGCVPRDAQLLAVLLSLLSTNYRGTLLEVATGEGKTIIVMMLALIRAISGRHVDIFTSSSVLARRDAEASSTVSAFFGFTVGHNCDEDNDTRKQSYRKTIVYGDTSTFERDYLLDIFHRTNIRGDRPYDVAVIDEVDSIFLDKGDQMLFLSSAIPGMNHLELLFIYIWIAVHARDLPKGSDSIKAVKAVIERQIQHGEIQYPKFLNDFVKSRLEIWVESAFIARNSLDRDNSYRVSAADRAVVVMDKSTGVQMKSTHLSDGIQQFLMLKHLQSFKPETLKSIFISNMKFFKTYQVLNGLSGTLGSEIEKSALHEIYGISVAFVPTFRAKCFQTLPPIVSRDQNGHYQGIIDAIKTIVVTERRPILIISENIHDALQVERAILRSKISGITLKLLLTDEDIIDYNLSPTDVILSTNIAGRGADIIISEDIESRGGLHVVLTYCPDNLRIEQQAFGRAARKGQRGSGQFIVFFPAIHLPTENDNMLPLHQLDLALCDRNHQERTRLLALTSYRLHQIELEESLLEEFHKSYLSVVSQHDKNSFEIDLGREASLVHFALWLDSYNSTLRAMKDMDDRTLQSLQSGFRKLLEDSFSKTFLESNHVYHVSFAKFCLIHANREADETKQKDWWRQCKEHCDVACSSDPEFAEFANYFLAAALINLDQNKYVEAMNVLMRSKYLFQRRLSQLSSTCELLRKINQWTTGQGYGAESDFYAKQVENKMTILQAIVASIDKAVGEWETDLLSVTAIELKDDDLQKLRQRLFESELFMSNRIIEAFEYKLETFRAKLNPLPEYSDVVKDRIADLLNRKCQKKESLSVTDFIDLLPNRDHLLSTLIDSGILRSEPHSELLLPSLLFIPLKQHLNSNELSAADVVILPSLKQAYVVRDIVVHGEQPTGNIVFTLQRIESGDSSCDLLSRRVAYVDSSCLQSSTAAVTEESATTSKQKVFCVVKETVASHLDDFPTNLLTAFVFRRSLPLTSEIRQGIFAVQSSSGADPTLYQCGKMGYRHINDINSVSLTLQSQSEETAVDLIVTFRLFGDTQSSLPTVDTVQVVQNGLSNEADSVEEANMAVHSVVFQLPVRYFVNIGVEDTIQKLFDPKGDFVQRYHNVQPIHQFLLRQSQLAPSAYQRGILGEQFQLFPAETAVHRLLSILERLLIIAPSVLNVQYQSPSKHKCFLEEKRQQFQDFVSRETRVDEQAKERKSILERCLKELSISCDLKVVESLHVSLSDVFDRCEGDIMRLLQTSADDGLVMANLFPLAEEVQDSMNFSLRDDLVDFAQQHGFDVVIKFKNNPYWWGPRVIVAIGLAQIVIGGILCYCGMPLVGIALVSEGIGDIMFALEAHVSGNFSWRVYMEHKIASVAFSILTCGLTSHLTKGVEIAAMTAKTIVQKTALKTIEELTSLGTSKAVDYVMDSISHSVVSFIREKARETFASPLASLTEALTTLYQQIGRKQDVINLMRTIEEQYIRSQKLISSASQYFHSGLNVISKALGKAAKIRYDNGAAFMKYKKALKLIQSIATLTKLLEAVYRSMTEISSFLQSAVKEVRDKVEAVSNRTITTTTTDTAFITHQVGKWEVLVRDRIVSYYNDGLLKPEIKRGINSLMAKLGRNLRDEIIPQSWMEDKIYEKNLLRARTSNTSKLAFKDSAFSRPGGGQKTIADLLNDSKDTLVAVQPSDEDICANTDGYTVKELRQRLPGVMFYEVNGRLVFLPPVLFQGTQSLAAQEKHYMDLICPVDSPYALNDNNSFLDVDADRGTGHRMPRGPDGKPVFIPLLDIDGDYCEEQTRAYVYKMHRSQQKYPKQSMLEHHNRAVAYAQKPHKIIKMRAALLCNLPDHYRGSTYLQERMASVRDIKVGVISPQQADAIEQLMKFDGSIREIDAYMRLQKAGWDLNKAKYEKIVATQTDLSNIISLRQSTTGIVSDLQAIDYIYEESKTMRIVPPPLTPNQQSLVVALKAEFAVLFSGRTDRAGQKVFKKHKDNMSGFTDILRRHRWDLAAATRELDESQFKTHFTDAEAEKVLQQSEGSYYMQDNGLVSKVTGHASIHRHSRVGASSFAPRHSYFLNPNHQQQMLSEQLASSAGFLFKVDMQLSGKTPFIRGSEIPTTAPFSTVVETYASSTSTAPPKTTAGNSHGASMKLARPAHDHHGSLHVQTHYPK